MSATGVTGAATSVTGSSLLPWLEAPLAQALHATRGHALLIHGPQGVGQFELALAVAAATLCEGEASGRPGGRACGHCSACHLIAARTHPDLLVLVPEVLQLALGWSGADEAGEEEGASKSKAKPSKEIRVAAVRAAIAFAQQTTSRGGAKLVVLYPAERMNPTSANMLLKTLEEPPGQARFILGSAAPQRLLPTVRSRCQVLRLPLPGAQLAIRWLQSRGVAEPQVVLAAAGGQPMDVIERLALGCDAQAWQRLPREVLAGQGTTLAAWPLPMVVDALQKLCHDALACAVGAAPRYFAAASVAGGGDVARLTACARTLREAARNAEHPLNAPLGIEALVQTLHRALRSPAAVSSSRERASPLATLRRP